MRVLIAEDDPISRRRLEGMLVKWGYEVTVARDGFKALQIFQETPPPSLAILDWIMPGMDGTEVCRKVREMSDHRSSYIILFATRNFLDSIVDGSEKGADDYMAKPFDFEELRVRLQRAMHILDLRNAFASGPLSGPLSTS